MDRQLFSYVDWHREGIRRFGADMLDWKFICPSCGVVTSVREWKDAGARENAAAFSCIGRYTGSAKTIFDKTGGPCNYTGGGLLGLNPVRVVFPNGKHIDCFRFADEE